jgi:hypothetical protein
MSGTAGLEGRYLRLLALYPAEHRRAHQEEMLGVLMTGARAGQRRPGLAESADLILGALRIRLRAAPGQQVGALWRDALAVVSTVLPLIILAYFGVLALSLVGLHGALAGALAKADAERLAVWTALAACVLLRLRRTAALVAAAVLIWAATPATYTPGWMYLSLNNMLIFVTLGLEVAALLASPGPRRGRQILTWKGYAAAVAVPAAVASAGLWVWLNHPAAAAAIAISVIALAIVGTAMTSALGWRVAALLSVPAFYAAAQFLVLPAIIGTIYLSMPGWEGPLRIMLTFLPVAALLGVAVAIARAVQAGHHAAAASGPDDGPVQPPP